MANVKWSEFPDGGVPVVGDQVPVLRSGVNTLTTPPTYLATSNNLSDVLDEEDAFNNISPISAKGQLITSDGDTNSALFAGSDGYVLSADSSEILGMKWIPRGAGTGSVTGPTTSNTNAVATFANESGTAVLSTPMYVLPTGEVGINTDTPKAGFHYKDSADVDGNMLFSAKGAVTEADMSNFEVNPYVLGGVLYTAFKNNSGTVYTSAQTQQGLYLNDFITTTTVLTSSAMGKMVTASGNSSFTITLPSISDDGLLGQWIMLSFNQSDEELITLVGQDELIGGQATMYFTSNTAIHLYAGGNGWTILSQSCTSGLYNPSVTLFANASTGSASTAQYMKVGNVVTVSGIFTVTPTSTGVAIGLSLPFPTVFSSGFKLGGVATGFFLVSGSLQGATASIQSDFSNNVARVFWLTDDTSSQDFTYTYTYYMET